LQTTEKFNQSNIKRCVIKWFKHISKSRNDALIRDLITLFGLAGEHVFYRTLELMADEFNVKTPGYNKFLVKSWIKNYHTSYKKTVKVLKFLRSFEDKKKRVFFKIRGSGNTQTIQLNCPKLKELCDNWTQKQLKKTTKSLRSKDEVTFRQEEEEEEDKDKKKKKKKKKRKQFTPPTFNDVVKYFIDNGYTKESAINAFKYYDEAEPPWTDSTGKKVRGWKQKMRGVWFRDKNKQSETKKPKIGKAGDTGIYDN